MKFERVVDGVARYIDGELYSAFNDWQEVIVRMAVGRVLGNKELLKQRIVENPLLMSFVMIDNEGEMDADMFLADLKKAISGKGGLKVSIPLFGSMKFTESDVDRLRQYIMGER